MLGLRDPNHLEALLARPPARRPSAAYLEAADPLRRGFLTASKSVRAKSAANKIRKILWGDFFRALLSARTNTLSLSGLWKRQGVGPVDLDRAGSREEGPASREPGREQPVPARPAPRSAWRHQLQPEPIP